MSFQNVVTFRPRHAICAQNAPLRRPALLIRSAQAGLAGFRRERDLRRALRSDSLPQPGHGLAVLRTLEAQLDLARCDGAASYDLHRHILVLVAILAEQRAATEAMQAQA